MSEDPTLTPDEAKALDDLVFALSGPKTLGAIASRLGLSRERVRLIEKKALTKLRYRLADGGLRAGDIGEASGEEHAWPRCVHQMPNQSR